MRKTKLLQKDTEVRIKSVSQNELPYAESLILLIKYESSHSESEIKKLN